MPARDLTLANLILRYRSDASLFIRDNSRAGRSLRRIQRQVRALRRSIAGLAAAYLGFSAAVRVARDTSEFESSLARIVTLVGVSREQLVGLRQAALDLSNQTGRPATELAEALFEITSAGQRGQAALNTLEAAGQAAAIGLGQTRDVARAVTSAINTYGAGVLGSSEATGILIATVREGQLEAQNLAGVLGQVTGVSEALGVSFNDLGAAFAVLSRSGLSESESATSIRALFNAIIQPSEMARTALMEFGLSFDELQNTIREGGLIAGIQRLNEVVAGSNNAISRIFPNVRAATAAFQLLGDETGEVDRIFRDLASAGSADLQQAFELLSEIDPTFASRQALQALTNTLVRELIPILPSLAAGLSAIARNLDLVAGAALAYVGTRLGAALGRLVLALPALVTGIRSLVAAMLALNFAALPFTATVRTFAVAGAVLGGALGFLALDTAAAADETERYVERLGTLERATLSQTSALLQQALAQREATRARLADRTTFSLGEGGAAVDELEEQLASLDSDIERIRGRLDELFSETRTTPSIDRVVEGTEQQAEIAAELLADFNRRLSVAQAILGVESQVSAQLDRQRAATLDLFSVVGLRGADRVAQEASNAILNTFEAEVAAAERRVAQAERVLANAQRFLDEVPEGEGEASRERAAARDAAQQELLNARAVLQVRREGRLEAEIAAEAAARDARNAFAAGQQDRVVQGLAVAAEERRLALLDARIVGENAIARSVAMQEQIAREAVILSGLEGEALVRRRAELETQARIDEERRMRLLDIARIQQEISNREQERAAAPVGSAREVDLRLEIEGLQTQLETGQISLQEFDAATAGLVLRMGDAAVETARARGEFEMLTQSQMQLAQIAGDVGQAFGGFARDVLLNFEDIGSAAEALGRRIVAAFAEALLIQPLIGAVTGGFGNLFGGGGINFAQHGGVHQGLTVVGEAGPELVDFRNPSRVYSNADLADAFGARQGNIVFAPTVTGVQDPETVRATVRGLLPEVVQVTTAAATQSLGRPSRFRNSVRS